MTRKAFYSFHYELDNSRAAQVRQMGSIEGNQPAKDNDWETIKKGGDKAIQNWIDRQIHGKSVAIVLIGSKTADRKWIKYEIVKAWNEGKGVLGVYIHNLKDLSGNQTLKGKNPFANLTVGNQSMANIVQDYIPLSNDSKIVYNTIKTNLAGWIETAIEIRQKHG